LVLKLTLPQAQMDRLKAVTLSARINGVDVAQETYTRAGDFLYERDVPASALTEDIVAVEFSLDKVAPAPPPDARELGIVVSSVGFMGH
jgi:hypothetical protein